jgi:hypothetical protein
MAIEPATDKATPEDFEAHVRDYSGFTRLLTIGGVTALVIALFVMLIIS